MIEFSKHSDVFFCMNTNIRKQVKDLNHINFPSLEFDSLRICCILSAKEELDYSATLFASVWWIWGTIYFCEPEMSKTFYVRINTKTKLVDSCILKTGLFSGLALSIKALSFKSIPYFGQQ